MVNAIDGAVIVALFAVIECAPPKELGIVIEAVQEPLSTTAVVANTSDVPLKVIETLSPAPKPEPVRFTVVPTMPLVLLVVILGPIVKGIGVVKEAAVVGPKAATLCGPAGAVGTAKLADHDPY